MKTEKKDLVETFDDIKHLLPENGFICGVLENEYCDYGYHKVFKLENVERDKYKEYLGNLKKRYPWNCNFSSGMEMISSPSDELLEFNVIWKSPKCYEPLYGNFYFYKDRIVFRYDIYHESEFMKIFGPDNRKLDLKLPKYDVICRDEKKLDYLDWSCSCRIKFKKTIEKSYLDDSCYIHSRLNKGWYYDNARISYMDSSVFFIMKFYMENDRAEYADIQWGTH